MSATELVHLNGSSWLIPGPTNIGIVETSEGVCLIDSGNDKEAGRKVNKLLADKMWSLHAILATHSNADHIGANDYLQRMTGCRVYATQAEKAFIESPQIEGSFLWGGFAPKEMKNKFFEAKPSLVTDIINEETELPGGLSYIALPGHFFQMAGFVGPDGVAWLGDALFGEAVLEKYKIPFIYDVEKFRETIEKLKTLEADYFVMSHGNVERTITASADLNLAVVDKMESAIMDILSTGQTFEAVLKHLCDKLDIRLDLGQYALVGSTVRSFLSYLANSGKAIYEFKDNRLMWTIS